MSRSWALVLMVLGAGWLELVGCGGLPTLSGESKTASQLLSKHAGAECGSSRPLIVDWESTDRAALEARARRGLVVVKYEGCTMDILPRCTVKADPKYEYVGVTPKADRVEMRDSVELYANIPVYAAKFEAKLAKSGALHADMMVVGQWDTNRPIPRQDELEGECAGASHVLMSMTVGAFEFVTGTGSEAGASAELLGAGAGAKTTSSEEVLNRDGDAKQCASAGDSDGKPPSGCGAILRLEAARLGASRQGEPSCAGGTQWNGEQCLAIKTDLACPPSEIPDKIRGCVPRKAAPTGVPGGLSQSGSGRGVAPVQSDCSDVEACSQRCEASDAKGCLGLGGLLRGKLKPGSASPDGQSAAAAFRKGCDGGEPSACVALGELYYQGLGVAKDAAAAPPLLEKACQAGDAVGCNDMGHVLSEGQIPNDLPRAASFYARACNDKSSLGCLGLGLLTRDGRGVPRDAAQAKKLFQQACRANVSAACKLAAP